MEFPERLIRLREINKITVKKLADELNTDEDEIISWEKGETVPNIENIIKLSKLYKTSTDYILMEKNNSDFFYKVLMLFMSIIGLGIFVFIIIFAISLIL